MKNITVPRSYKTMINRVKKLYPTGTKVIIAGGAIRDLYGGVHVKDIDIYVDISNCKNKSLNKVSNHADAQQIMGSDHFRKLGEAYDGQEAGIFNVYNFEFYGRPDVDLIELTMDPIKYVNEFYDFNICKGYFDGKKMTFTPEMLKDFNNKTLTHNPNLSDQAVASDGRLDKLQDKYPGFTEVSAMSSMQSLFNSAVDSDIAMLNLYGKMSNKYYITATQSQGRANRQVKETPVQVLYDPASSMAKEMTAIEVADTKHRVMIQQLKSRGTNTERTSFNVITDAERMKLHELTDESQSVFKSERDIAIKAKELIHQIRTGGEIR